MRELNKKISETQEELTEYKEKNSTLSKKMAKIEELRMEEMTKMNLKIAELEKAK